MKISKETKRQANKTPMNPQKIKDTLLLLSNYSADGGLSTVYANAGFKGYDKHELKVVDSYPFLLWRPGNSSKIDTPELTYSIDWEKIFNAKPYISYESDSDGYTFIQAPAIVKRDAERFRTNRQQRYNDFINSISPGSINPLKLLSEIHGLHSMLEQQINRQTEKLENIDQEFMRLIKVYYYEVAKSNFGNDIPNQEQLDQHHNLIHDTRHLYQWGIRHIASTETILQKWIPKRIKQPFVPAPIGQSLASGIKALMPIKEKLLDSIVPIVEKLIHLETLKYYALNDMPILTDDERDMPGDFEPRNETGKKMKEDKKGINELYLPEIIRIANELIEKKGRAWYVTPEGTAKRIFYHDVHRKLLSKTEREKPHPNTVQDRINTYVLKKVNTD